MSNASWIISPQEFLVGKGTKLHYICRPWTSMLTLELYSPRISIQRQLIIMAFHIYHLECYLRVVSVGLPKQLNMYMEKYAIEAVALSEVFSLHV